MQITFFQSSTNFNELLHSDTMEYAYFLVNVENVKEGQKPHFAEIPFSSLLRPVQRRNLTDGFVTS